MTVRPGPLMAACDVFEIVVEGQGGHISKPQEAVDPLAIGAQIVTNLQHIVAREVDPEEIAVVGVTQFEAGDSVGVIPDTARIEGGTNVFSPFVRDLLERRIREIAERICAAHGAGCEFTYTRGYDAVVNDEATTAVVERAAREAFGDEAVDRGRPGPRRRGLLRLPGLRSRHLPAARRAQRRARHRPRPPQPALRRRRGRPADGSPADLPRCGGAARGRRRLRTVRR